MPKNKKTYYLIILDKSGSMGSVIDETIQGFNEQVQMIKNLQQKHPEQEIIVSLTTFNENVSHDLFMQPPSELKEMKSAYHTIRRPIFDRLDNQKTPTSSDKIFYYRTSGMTALYDAIGKSVKKLKKNIKEEIKNDLASAVVVIITDGHENSSRKYSYDDIQKMIRKLEKSPNWTFSYLGATPDAVDIARGLNIRAHNTMRFEKKNMHGLFAQKLSASFDKYIASKNTGVISKDFLSTPTEDEKNKD